MNSKETESVGLENNADGLVKTLSWCGTSELLKYSLFNRAQERGWRR
jgi:hypothetical protein